MAVRKGFFKIVIDFSAAEASALSFLRGDVQGEEGLVYEISAFEPNIVEPRGRPRAAWPEELLWSRRCACARRKRLLLKSEGSGPAIYLCAPKISTIDPFLHR